MNSPISGDRDLWKHKKLGENDKQTSQNKKIDKNVSTKKMLSIPTEKILTNIAYGIGLRQPPVKSSLNVLHMILPNLSRLPESLFKSGLVKNPTRLVFLDSAF